MTIVTQDFDTTVNLWIKRDLVADISKALMNTPLELYLCRNAIDTFMIPSFIMILDGRLITQADKDIDTLECYLSGWSGKMKKCKRCRNQKECTPEDVGGNIFDGPEYNPPIIMLNPDKKQRQVDGLFSLTPSEPFTQPFSEELALWLRSTVSFWHTKVQRWRIEYDRWVALEEIREDYRRPPKWSDVARARWLARKSTIKLPAPLFD